LLFISSEVRISYNTDKEFVRLLQVKADEFIKLLKGIILIINMGVAPWILGCELRRKPLDSFQAHPS
jgi:hypothetical protein